MGSDPLLVIDAGNTRIKWGVRVGDAWHALGAVPTEEAKRLEDAWRNLPSLQGAIASNVAGADVGGALRNACKSAHTPLEFIRSQAQLLHVRNEYAQPEQLGTDRWAALIAAHQVARGHKLVVNVGTALTVDALTGEGQFRGGLIVPGPALMRRSLDKGTAALRLTEGAFSDFPRSTPDAITSGAIAACVGAIGQLGKAMERAGCRPASIVLSGGGAGEIAPHLPIPATIHENLVLEGLVLIARNS